MKDFFKSKRNWTIIAQGALGTAAALWPEKFAAISTLLRAVFGMQ